MGAGALIGGGVGNGDEEGLGEGLGTGVGDTPGVGAGDAVGDAAGTGPPMGASPPCPALPPPPPHALTVSSADKVNPAQPLRIPLNRFICHPLDLLLCRRVLLYMQHATQMVAEERTSRYPALAGQCSSLKALCSIKARNEHTQHP
jgi:hypothetical protein